MNPTAIPVPRIVSGRGARLTDDQGHVWLDARSGGFGPGHPAVTDALRTQLGRVALSSRVLISRPLAAAVVALARFCPPPLEVSYLCNSGDEALDFALKLAKGTHPDRHRVLGVEGADYGALCHGLALAAGTSILPGAPLQPLTLPADELDGLPDQIDHDAAAVVLAPAAPGRRLHAFGVEWWRRLRRRCTETGCLLVLDERLTGPARLGTRLGCEALAVVPDVLVLGEQLGANAVPLGATITSPETYRAVLGHRNPTVHGSTFGANPLAAAAVVAVIEAVERDGLAAAQHRTEQTLREALDPIATDVDGAGPTAFADHGVDGALGWVRLDEPVRADALMSGLASAGVLARRSDRHTVALVPPLTASTAEITALGDAVGKAITSLRRAPTLEPSHA